ncbi:type 1 glutamine amidotransferase [Chitinophaga filiformis]|uniref:type 1 glutamine amidotransferase n=1 Tax=Chitinophaga filiformis TaxID=104663 RepID=UPI001F465BC5|nr:amidotransferase [Chitinophaga filiformis]
MHIHIFQHVSFEGPGCISDWANTHHHRVTFTRWYEHPEQPDMTEVDLLVVMGGPMSVHDEAAHPWLKTEKQCILQAIQAGKKVLGICLGAQLIATTLGANVYPNTQPEIGWFPVVYSTALLPPALAVELPEAQTVFHWHGDTFDLPADAVCFASTPVTRNQAFLIGHNVMGLQYHFEVTPESLSEMLLHGMDELIPAAYVQDADTIKREQRYIEGSNITMYRLLDFLTGNYG